MTSTTPSGSPLIHNYCPSHFSVVTSPLSLHYINFKKNTNLIRNQQEAIRRWKRNKYKKQNRMNSGQVSSRLSKQCKIDNLLTVRPMKYSNIKTVNTELQLSGTSFFSRARQLVWTSGGRSNYNYGAIKYAAVPPLKNYK